MESNYVEPQTVEPAQPQSPVSRCTAFAGYQRIAAGQLSDVALEVKRAMQSRDVGLVLIYDDDTGRQVEVDLRGSDDDIVARLPLATAPTEPDNEPAAGPRGRGRPRLGVVSREVTLLPRHWDWLSLQPGGASVALRKLVEEARLANQEQDRQRRKQEAAYRFLSSMAGDMLGFEDAARALFAQDREQFERCVTGWPQDVSDYAMWLAFETDAAG